ncbi:thioesterase II family protein [Streptomyces sp. NPDC003388]|uniref:Thioesterase II n=2 Tax=Streptomyces TaxID=1883 RepID=E3VWJ4_STRAE|nr:thioesterase domain-containing protein [Streptomyces sp. 1-11]ADO85582.1 thioesterase II [Streptomyces arenae]GEK01127.1 thioesterase [Streptomyces sp. 1-11]
MTGNRRPRWFLEEPSPDAGARLFALPYSGCGASMYRKWPRFTGDVELCPVQFPGRENRLREDPFMSFGSLADMLCEALLPYLDRPFAFFGHCSSALIAYETALRLERRGYPVPARLFVSSQVAPHKGVHGRFLDMSDDELREEVRTLITELGGVPRPDMVELSLEVLLFDVAAHKRYGVADPDPLPCPATVLGWDEDVEVPHQLLHEWSDLGETTFTLLKGPHYGFLEGPDELMRTFATGLGRAPGPSLAG